MRLNLKRIFVVLLLSALLAGALIFVNQILALTCVRGLFSGRNVPLREIDIDAGDTAVKCSSQEVLGYLGVMMATAKPAAGQNGTSARARLRLGRFTSATVYLNVSSDKKSIMFGVPTSNLLDYDYWRVDLDASEPDGLKRLLDFLTDRSSGGHHMELR